MDFNKDIEIKITAYLEGNMSVKETEAFEKECQQNQELQDMVTILKDMDTVYDDNNWLTSTDTEKIKDTSQLFRTEGVKTFSENVKAAQHRYKNNSSNKVKQFTKYFASTAAVALLALFANYYFFTTNYSAEELYNNYYSTQDLPSFIIQSSNTNAKVEAETLFKQKKYTAALKAFNTINKSSESINPSVILYTAVCYLELNDYDNAIRALKQLKESNTLDFHKAYWFETLVYLKQNKTADAKKTLEIISKNNSYYNHYKAIELLKKLK